MDPDPTTSLQELGFTESEARVYLSLLDGPPTTGYRLGLRAGMPRSLVYEALGRLEARGAVLRSGGGRGTLYRPVPSEQLLDHLEGSYRARFAGLRRALRRRRRPKAGGEVWTGRGQEIIAALGERLVAGARQELLLVLPDEQIDALSEPLRAACGRGVRVGVVVTGKLEAPCGFSVRHPPRESEVQQLDRFLLVCADGGEVLIADLRGPGSATHTANPLLVHIARQFVWMELFTQRLHASGAPDPLAALPPRDRKFLEGLTGAGGGRKKTA